MLWTYKLILQFQLKLIYLQLITIKALLSLITKVYTKFDIFYNSNKLEIFVEKILDKLEILFLFVVFYYLEYLEYKYEFISIKQKVKKWLYTSNHKKIGIQYFYYSLITAMLGSYFATCIRLEMSSPGSPFFNGDSLKYLQVITAHALIMIFFVVVPIFFGGFANYFLPYHVGSKDVAYPRLNNFGFWIQPCGFILIGRMGGMRLEFWAVELKTSFFSELTKVDNFLKQFRLYEYLSNVTKVVNNYDFNRLSVIIKDATEHLKRKDFNSHVEYVIARNLIIDELCLYKNLKFNINVIDDKNYSYKILFWKDLYNSVDNFWFLTKNALKTKRQKRFLVKCVGQNQTVAGWTFITPFSSNVEYTGFGIQDMLILGVYYAGISTTISIVNLLITRRVLSMVGLRGRRILVPFISTTILLMLRALSVITPVLGSAMLMLLADRHWKTSFFDFSYGGDPIFFHHLFWFFGHPEVYVLIIPAFGIINSILPHISFRRIASKHHLIWAIYVMNYMGFLVWGHHMYLIGLDHRSRSLYSTITIMISLPATIKVVNWTYTLLNGMIKNNLILYGIISFIFFFLVAGFTGMWLSHVSLNISMHDSLYVVAHFHLMLSGAVIIAIFVGFYFYYYSILMCKFSKFFAFAHIIYYTIGQWVTFVPMFWVAFSGLPRRLHDFPLMYLGWQSLSTAGHFVTMLGVFFFYGVLFESFFDKKLTTNNALIIPRLYSEANYLVLRNLNVIVKKKKKISPKKKTRKNLHRKYL